MRSIAGKLPNATSFFVVVSRTTSNYSEPRFHKSFVVSSQQAFLRWVSVRTQPVNTYRCTVRVVKYMYKKTYLSFRFVTSRPSCQMKHGDQTPNNTFDGDSYLFLCFLSLSLFFSFLGFFFDFLSSSADVSDSFSSLLLTFLFFFSFLTEGSTHVHTRIDS